MLNFHQYVRSVPTPNRLVIGDFLFAEYTCGVRSKKVANWAETDYVVHIVAGRKTWHTPEGAWQARAGETIFVHKGATVVEQHFEEDACMLVFSLPDALVRKTVQELAGSLGIDASRAAAIKSAVRVESDTALIAFFESMRTYISGNDRPSEALVHLKVKELVTGILTGGRNPDLAAYFWKMGESHACLIPEIMEANFRSNLSLEEFAALCHRSLSSFKREFQAHFKETPGRWLLRKRLDHASVLLRGSEMNVTEVSFESGFQNSSHFSRAFKKQFGVAPSCFQEPG